MGTDFIPQAWAAFAAWSNNFATHLPSLAAKYGISAATLAQVQKDNAWVQFWVAAKFSGKQQLKQLDEFVKEVTNGELNAPALNDPVWQLPADAPDAVKTGVKKRYREIAAFMKAQKSIYVTADGDLIGIVTAEEADLSPDSFTPSVDFDSLSNFALEAEFRKFGLDALRVEYRRKGGEWQLAATLTSSPGVFNIEPTSAGVAEQIELRCVFIVKNQPYGNWSPTYTAFIQP